MQEQFRQIQKCKILFFRFRYVTQFSNNTCCILLILEFRVRVQQNFVTNSIAKSHYDVSNGKIKRYFKSDELFFCNQIAVAYHSILIQTFC